MRPLTPRQQEVLDLIKSTMLDTGMPPTRAEIARQLGFRSANAAEEHLKALAKKGVIEILPGTSRGIKLNIPLDDEAEEEGLPALGLLRWLDPKIIGEILADEHPQAIAVLLLQLDTDVAAAALAALPEDLHTPVLHRVARLGPVSRQAIEILEHTLNAKIEKLHGTIPLTMGGIRHAADIINRSHRSIEKNVMPKIGKIDKQLAKELENEMFKFEHLFVLDTKMTGVLLREIESDTLILALKGLEEEQREQFFGAMSSRAADGLRDEIEARGRVKKTEVEAAQKDIVTIAKRLIADGELIMGEGDEDYV